MLDHFIKAPYLNYKNKYGSRMGPPPFQLATQIIKKYIDTLY